MTNTPRNQQFQPDWVFNFVLKLAVVACLVTLTIGLIGGVSPLTSLLRSGVAFVVFVTLAWAASLIWPVIEVEETEEETESDELNRDNLFAEENNQSPTSPVDKISEAESGVVYEQTRESAVVETAEMEPVG